MKYEIPNNKLPFSQQIELPLSSHGQLVPRFLRPQFQVPTSRGAQISGIQNYVNLQKKKQNKTHVHPLMYLQSPLGDL